MRSFSFFVRGVSMISNLLPYLSALFSLLIKKWYDSFINHIIYNCKLQKCNRLFYEFMADDLSVLIKIKSVFHFFSFKYSRHPVAIIIPHLIIRYGVNWKPFGFHLLSFHYLSFISVKSVQCHILIPFWLILEIEMKISYLLKLICTEFDSSFLLKFSCCSFSYGLISFHFSSSSIVFSYSKSSLFHAEKHVFSGFIKR